MKTAIQDTSVWLKYYDSLNYQGPQEEQVVVYHGDVLQLSNADGSWNKNSRSNGVNGLSVFTLSDADVNNPQQNYFCHLEDYSANEISYFKEAFLFAAHPLKAVHIDSNIVKRVKISLQALVSSEMDEITCPDILSATSIIPQTSTEMTSVTAGLLDEGTLGFVEIAQGMSTEVAVRYGYFDDKTGTATWTGSGTLTLVYDNGNVILQGTSGLPAQWQISNPVQMPDGSWKIDICQYAPEVSVRNYPETWYYGDLVSFSIGGLNTQIQFNEGFWSTKSLRIPNINMGILYSGVTIPYQYKPENYHQIVFTEPEQPDLPALYGEGHSTAYCFVAEHPGYCVWLKFATSSSDYTAIFCASTMPLAFRYAGQNESCVLTGSRDGVQNTSDNCEIFYGHTDAEGYYVNAGHGSLTVTLIGDMLMISDIANFPANWVFSKPEKQADGNWLITLTDTL